MGSKSSKRAQNQSARARSKNASKKHRGAQKKTPWFTIGVGAAIAAAVIAVALTAIFTTTGEDATVAAGPGNSAAGAGLYAANCAQCHGTDLDGTDQGPPFLDSVYAPNHHADEAFRRAVSNGVQPHHWNFGAMPAQPQIDDVAIADIIAFVREKQAEAGVTRDPTHG